MRRSIFLTLVLVGTTCDPETTPSPSKDPAPPGAVGPAESPTMKPANTETVEDRMHAHFTAGAQIRDALVRGDLGATKDPASWLEETRGKEELREAWNPHLARMQTAAHDVRYASDLEDAAHAAARIAGSCGACHTALEAVALAPSEGPRDVPDTAMQRHEWALDGMWRGLTVPDPKAWKKSAEILAESSIPLQDMGDRNLQDELAPTVQRMTDLASRASQASTPATRVEVYGELLGTCAGCHAKLVPVDSRD